MATSEDEQASPTHPRPTSRCDDPQTPPGPGNPSCRQDSLNRSVPNGYQYDSFPIYDTSIAADVRSSHASPNGNISDTPTKPTSARTLGPDLLRGLLMVIMALDHVAVSLNTWEHGTGREGENDGQIIRRWNIPVAYVVRSLTHLCGSGFTFLLGMGVVYLGRSRTRMGWSAMRLVRYFAMRMAVLIVVQAIFGLVVSGGRIWFLNMVLFSLAVNYFLAGLLWLAIDGTEKRFTRTLAGKMKRSADAIDHDGGAEQPLLPNRAVRKDSVTTKAERISWQVGNALLFGLACISILWNIWLSPYHGHCQSASSSASLFLPSLDGVAVTATGKPLLDIWFWPVMDIENHIVSGFPPLAWTSFAILGLLYGRIMVARPWSRHSLVLGHTSVGLGFLLVFILTRVLRVGNLSEGCLQTPEHKRHPDQNPYLVSPASFFYIIKYPPDVAYWALSLGGNFFLLALLGALPARFASRLTMLLDFGTTALFFYISHLLLIFAMAIPIIRWFGHDTDVPDFINPEKKSRVLHSLWAYFGVWAAAVLLLWPVCRMYSRFKATKSADSIWRFF